MRKLVMNKMGLFSKIFNQAKTASLSPEEQKLDSILKQAAKDASVILIPTENKGVYDVNVTLANGKPISYYGKLQYSYGVDDDEPFINVKFVSNSFDNKEKRDSITKDLIEWRRDKYGYQYNTFYGNYSEDGLCFVIMGDGCFGKIPAIPDKHNSFKYTDILDASGEVEADKKFCEFLIQKISGYTSVMIKSLEYSLGCGHKWPTKDDIIAREKAQAAKEAAERKAKAQRARNYPSTMKRILEDAVKRINWELTPQLETNAFLIGDYDEGRFYLTYSTDSKNPSVDIEFFSREFENEQKAKKMSDILADSGFLKSFDAYVRHDNTIRFNKTIAIHNIEDEQTAASNIKDGINTLIDAVTTIRDKWQRWPTKAEEEARHREQAAREAAEEWVRNARAAAAQQAAEAEQRKQMIAKCKLNIGKLRAEVAKCEADCTSHRGDDYYRRRRDKAKADLAEEKYKLQRLEAGEDLRFIYVY